MSKSNLIKLQGVGKTYAEGAEGLPALDSVDLEIGAGEFVAIMGPSGSGKTTLLSAIGGMNPVSEGKVLIDGIDIYALNADSQADYRAAYLGFVFQQHHLLSHLTAQENVLLAAAMKNPDHSALDAAMAALERVNLRGKAHRLPGELSRGEQARVGIARALMNDPPIVLADEPTGTLDSRTGHQILSLLKQLNEQGRTVVMVTHSEDAAKFATRVIRLADGRVVGDERRSGSGLVAGQGGLDGPCPEGSGDSPDTGGEPLGCGLPVSPNPLGQEDVPAAQRDDPDGPDSPLGRARSAFANARRTTMTVISYAVGAALTIQGLLILYLIWQGLTGPAGH